MSSNDKGLLIPRVNIVDLATAAPITTPANSLLVYNTNAASGVGYYFWDGTKWVKLSDANSNSDHDWYEVGTTSSPNNITDNIFTQGNVGIGTIAPVHRLDVDGGVILLGGNGSYYWSERVDSDFDIIQSATSSKRTFSIHPSISGSDVLAVFTNNGGAFNPALHVKNTSGFVGVGTQFPSRKVHIAGSGIGVQKFKIEEASAGGESLSLGNGTAASTLAFSNTGDFWLGAVNNVDNNMLATEADFFVQGSTGNIGIGTNTPQAKLNIPNVGTINTGDWTQASLLIGDVTTGLAMDFNEIYSKSNAGFLIGTYSNTPMRIVTNNTLRMAFTQAGNIGIGNAVPGFQLQLSTNSAAKPTSGAWTVASDRRLKENISVYEGGLEEIMEIEPVWFTYTGIAGMPKETGVGVIAQDLKKVAPYMVDEWIYTDEETKKEEKYLGVDNGAMTYMLINAVKELKKENDLLKERIDKLEKR